MIDYDCFADCFWELFLLFESFRHSASPSAFDSDLERNCEALNFLSLLNSYLYYVITQSTHNAQCRKQSFGSIFAKAENPNPTARKYSEK